MLTPFLERHFTYLNHICGEWLELPIEEVKRISSAIGKLLGYPDGFIEQGDRHM